MTFSNRDWNIINKNLFIDGVKFWRAGHFNMVRYFKKVEKSVPLPPSDATDGEAHEVLGQDGGEVCDQGQDEEHDHGCEAEDVSQSIFDEDPRENKQKYGVVWYGWI